MAIERVCIHFTNGDVFEVSAEDFTSGNILSLPTTDLEGQEYQLMVRWVIPHSETLRTEMLETGLEQAFGDT